MINKSIISRRSFLTNTLAATGGAVSVAELLYPHGWPPGSEGARMGEPVLSPELGRTADE